MKYKNLILSSCLLALFAYLAHFSSARVLDLQIMKTVHSLHTPFLDFAFVPFVILGSSQVSGLILLLLSVWFYRNREFQKAYLSLAALLIGMGVVIACKRTFLIEAPGPEFRGSFSVEWNSISIKTQSCFPSGHTFRAALLCAFAFIGLGTTGRKPFLHLILILIPFATALGMVYYGFHWLSDVIAGLWLALLMYQAVCVILFVDNSRES